MAPLNRRLTDTEAQPVLKQHLPLKPISCGSLRSRAWLRRERLPQSSSGTGSVATDIHRYLITSTSHQLIAVKQVSLDTSNPKDAKGEYSRLQEEVELLKTLRHINIVGFLGTSLYQHRRDERVLTSVKFTVLILDIHWYHDIGITDIIYKQFHVSIKVINETGYGSKSDIWSVGCTVFEMATGKPPLAHMNRMAALFFIGAQSGLMPSLPDGFSEHAKNFNEQRCISNNTTVYPLLSLI
uniref:Mitogen-activated protein kinase kinase kinase 19 n=1 Tax=Cynoglossus semilaevis TaxID=244447 RepID=A0A3P8WSK6_CYNSE